MEKTYRWLTTPFASRNRRIKTRKSPGTHQTRPQLVADPNTQNQKVVSHLKRIWFIMNGFQSLWVITVPIFWLTNTNNITKWSVPSELPTKHNPITFLDRSNNLLANNLHVILSITFFVFIQTAMDFILSKSISSNWWLNWLALVGLASHLKWNTLTIFNHLILQQSPRMRYQMYNMVQQMVKNDLYDQSYLREIPALLSERLLSTLSQ